MSLKQFNKLANYDARTQFKVVFNRDTSVLRIYILEELPYFLIHFNT